jgi:oxygen-independent coproporphyrinogen-3 oxidase
VREAFSLARKVGFDNINTDLISGLPSDNYESFKNTLDEVIGLDPESITVHTLTLKRASSLFREADLVSDEDIAKMVSYSVDRLCKEGYNPYYLYRQKNTLNNLENVGYAKSGKESLYNIFIMEETQTILAAGAAASTKLCDSKSGKIERIYNYKFPYEYINRFETLMEKKKDIDAFYEKYPINR